MMVQQQAIVPPGQEGRAHSSQTASTSNSQPKEPGSAPTRFTPIAQLGKGSQGFVQLVYDTLYAQQVAVKYMHRGFARKFEKYVRRELKTHSSLSTAKHPHIVEFLEVFLTPNFLGIAMEYVNGKDLQNYLEKYGGKLPQDVARFIFQQLIIAVDFCHRKGKVNRDIKLANILVQTRDAVTNESTPPLVKLCDFGFSKDKYMDSIPQTQLGTALFSAPEIFLTGHGQAYDGEAADMWSCGVVLHTMLFGCHPFLPKEAAQRTGNGGHPAAKADRMMHLIENSVAGKLQLPPEAAEMPAAVDLVRKLLVPQPEQRANMRVVLSHPWFLERLPAGALMLNDLYLSQSAQHVPRQSPETIDSVVRAAAQESAADLDRAASATAAATTAINAINATRSTSQGTHGTSAMRGLALSSDTSSQHGGTAAAAAAAHAAAAAAAVAAIGSMPRPGSSAQAGSMPSPYPSPGEVYSMPPQMGTPPLSHHTGGGTPMGHHGPPSTGSVGVALSGGVPPQPHPMAMMGMQFGQPGGSMGGPPGMMQGLGAPAQAPSPVMGVGMADASGMMVDCPSPTGTGTLQDMLLQPGIPDPLDIPLGCMGEEDGQGGQGYGVGGAGGLGIPDGTAGNVLYDSSLLLTLDLSK